MNPQLEIDKPLVTAQWLFENLDESNLVILDATIPKVGQSASDMENNKAIKNARFFDIKNVFSDTNAPFPNTIVKPEFFEEEVQKLGINNDTAIVVYDRHGVYSGPRAWWLFKAMGHNNVAVLDGGLPAWVKANFPCKIMKSYIGKSGNFKANYQPNKIYDYNNVLDAISDEGKLTIDARSTDRFKGLKPEPRKGLRSGHIPNSVNLPFTELLDGEKVLPAKKIAQKFEKLTDKNSNLIFTCGSGITACILALGASIAGYENITVYDGSWTEWGSLHQLPIEV